MYTAWLQAAAVVASSIGQYNESCSVIQEERLLRDLLSSSSAGDACSSPHHTRSDEEWLVSSETKKTPDNNHADLEELQERVQLRDDQCNQLLSQLQQERHSAAALQQSLEGHQREKSDLRRHLAESYGEAEELRKQLQAVQCELEEAHQRAELQEVLSQQLTNQLQEVTQHRDECKRLSEKLKSELVKSKEQEVMLVLCLCLPALTQAICYIVWT